VALSIFIATQRAIFLSKEAKSSIHQSAVFNYVNDYRNWADFGSWTSEDPEMKIVYPQVTVGKEHLILGKEKMDQEKAHSFCQRK
jgi:hypothetical protein